MLAAGLMQQRQKCKALTERQTALLDDFDSKRQQLELAQAQQQTLQTQLESLQRARSYSFRENSTI